MEYVIAYLSLSVVIVLVCILSYKLSKDRMTVEDLLLTIVISIIPVFNLFFLIEAVREISNNTKFLDKTIFDFRDSE